MIPIRVIVAELTSHSAMKIVPGSRIRLSSLGIQRCPKFKSQTGTVVSVSATGTSFRILIDGRKLPLTLHKNYVESFQEPRAACELERKS